jgi:acyl carrier protein
LLAAVEWTQQQAVAPHLHYAIDWVRLQFEQKCAVALSGERGVVHLPTAESVCDRIESYAESIGNLQQTLPGVDHEMDPLLRQTRPRKTPLQRSDVGLAMSTLPAGSAPLLSSGAIYRQLNTLVVDERCSQLAFYLRNQIARELRLGSGENIAPWQSLFDLGLNSLSAITLKSRFEYDLDCSFDPTLFFDYPTVASLADYLARQVWSSQQNDESPVQKNVEKISAATKSDVECLASCSDDEMRAQLDAVLRSIESEADR